MKALYDYKDPFANLRSLGIGFDGFMKQVQEATELIDKSFKNLPGYPPYNVIKNDENKYTIELAVAGFGKNSIDIEFVDGVLVINGKIESDSDKATEYLHKGIADRAFSRKFVLADTVEIKNAEYINGMLKIFLENIIPEHKKPRKIDINDAETEIKPSWFSKAVDTDKEKEVA